MTSQIDEMAADNQYPTADEIEAGEGLYLSGAVDRDNLNVVIRMGNDETILDAVLTLDDIHAIIGRLEANAGELEQVIENSFSKRVSEAVDALSQYPVLELVWAYIDRNDMWGSLAAWAESEGFDDHEDIDSFRDAEWNPYV